MTAQTQPHAYLVEALWNRGSSSERWGRAMEMGMVTEPLNEQDAAELVAEMIDEGHSPTAVRVVALTVSTPPGSPTGADQ